MASEYPIDQVKRARNTLPRGGAEEELRPDWSLQWSQLREIRIVVPKAMFHPNLVVLEIDAGPIKRKLRALQWSGDAAKGKAAVAESIPWRERFFSGFRPARETDRTLRNIEQSALVATPRKPG